MSGIHRPMSQMRKLETKENLFRIRKRILKYLVLSFLKQEGCFHSADTFSQEAALGGDYQLCDNIDLDIILQRHVGYFNKKEIQFRIRKRILKYLVLSFLKQEGCFHSADTFSQEAALGGDYQLCDNIDLDIILQDYISYYLMRFNKQPQFLRNVEMTPPPRPQTRKQRRRPDTTEPVEEKLDADLPASFTVTSLSKDEAKEKPEEIPPVDRKPLSVLLRNASQEKKEMVELLYQDIIKPTGVTWDDIKGLTAAKNLLIESVVYPVRYPEVFTGLLEPWRGVLLHGPPGTGKTLLARAVASEGCCTFFNVSCSTIINKWRGESEKIVKVLFEMASYYSPSIIFIDEVETLASDRSSPGEHEASRRLKAQLLTELDGIGRNEGVVFLLANTNMPWDLDPAMIRRLEKRIYIPLPDSKTRAELFEKFLGSKSIELYPKVDFQDLAAKTDGYSGSDIKLVCKEALMSTVRKMLPNMTGKNLFRMVQFEGDTSSLHPKQLNCISDVVKEEGFEGAKVTIKALGGTGENYVSSVKRIIVEKNGKTFRMVAKLAPKEQRFLLAVNTHVLFNNEYVMYSQVLPKFTAMEEAAGIPASERLRYPKFYGALTEEPLEFILLEDLQIPGFIMFDKTKSFSNEAIKLIFKNLARLHSGSYALKSQEPDTFNEFRETLGDFWYQAALIKDAMTFFNGYDEDAKALLSSDKHQAVLKKYGGNKEEYQRDLHNTYFESRHSAIVHGDCWANNILFRLEGDIATECCLIDYQAPGASSPVADIFYVIVSCTDYEGRAKHFHEWMDYYHSELDKNLNKFGLKSEDWYSRERLYADLKRYGPLGLLNAFFMASVITREHAEAAKMLEALIKVNDGGAVLEKALKECSLTNASEKTQNNFIRMASEAIDSFLELGLIQID